MVALGKVVACWIVGGACLVGCGATTSGESEPGVGDTSAQTGAVVEFEDRFSSLGVFQVTRDDNGKLGIAVRDSIENIGADSVLQKTMAQRSLLGIYSVLHPDAATVPPALARLADELDAQQRLAPASPPPQSEPVINHGLEEERLRVQGQQLSRVALLLLHGLSIVRLERVVPRRNARALSLQQLASPNPCLDLSVDPVGRRVLRRLS
jgi:hypothetical protein